MITYQLPQWQQSDLPPITTSLSDFMLIRENQYVLVDKTAYICGLFRNNKVFLSRPRRFGKSLLLSTIQELFTHGTQNFEGLAIHDLWHRPCRPVISLSLFGLNSPETFEEWLCHRLRTAFVKAGFVDARSINAKNFMELSSELEIIQGSTSIVMLIDECDFPLSANLNDREAFDHNKKILRMFYAWLRSLGKIEFLMFTGIGRYQDTSMFTGQDIKDISLDPSFANLLGYTQEELESYFAPHISAAASLLKISEEQLLDTLKRQYDGFCFDRDASTSVYNPISINNFFQQVVEKPESVPVFGAYWMNSSNAAPVLRTFLDRNKPSLAFLDDVKDSGIEINQSDLNNAYTFDELKFPALLTQTGYLTIKEVIKNSQVDTVRSYSCSFPNQEIEQAYVDIFFRYITQSSYSGDGNWIREAANNLQQAFYQKDIAQVVTEINVFLCAIPYDLWTNAKEATYRTYISWCLQLSVTNKVRSETLNNRGRSDLEFTFNDCTYIIELKRLPQQKDPKNAVKLADVAQQQVYDRGYGFNDQVDGDTKRYGLALVIAERSRQIEYWRYFDGTHVIAENAVAPISMENPPEQAK